MAIYDGIGMTYSFTRRPDPRIAALLATTLAYRNFFTSAHQLREPPAP
jgi:ABC-type iron transport system FetAB permease component